MYSCIEFNREVSLTDYQEEPNGSVAISLKTIDTCSMTPVAQKINRTLSMELFGKDTDHLKEAAIQFANNYLETYQKTYSKLYREEQKRGIPKEWYDYYITFRGEKPEVYANTLNYRVELTRKEGGATEHKEVRTFCFSKDTGNLLSPDSLFTNEYAYHLNALISDDLLKQFDCNSKKELQEKGIGRFTDIYIPRNFLLTDKGILFIYNPHEIAPYDQGIITCLIDYDDLYAMWQPQYRD